MQAIPPIGAGRGVYPQAAGGRFAGKGMSDDEFSAVQRSVQRITRSVAEVRDHGNGRYLSIGYYDEAEKNFMIEGLKKHGATELTPSEFDSLPRGTVRLTYQGLKIQLENIHYGNTPILF